MADHGPGSQTRLSSAGTCLCFNLALVSTFTEGLPPRFPHLRVYHQVPGSVKTGRRGSLEQATRRPAEGERRRGALSRSGASRAPRPPHNTFCSSKAGCHLGNSPSPGGASSEARTVSMCLARVLKRAIKGYTVRPHTRSFQTGGPSFLVFSAGSELGPATKGVNSLVRAPADR